MSNIVKGPENFRLFKELMDLVIVKSKIIPEKAKGKKDVKITIEHFNIKELEQLSEIVNKSLDGQGSIGHGTLRDYRYMYIEKEGYQEFKANEDKLYLLRYFSGNKTITFQFSYHIPRTLNLLVIKEFQAFGDEKGKLRVSEIIEGRFKRLIEAEEMNDRVLINIKEPSINKQLNNNEAVNIAKREGADIVMWCDVYDRSDESNIWIRLHTLFVNSESKSLKHLGSKLVNEQYLDPIPAIEKNTFYKGPDFLLYYALAWDAYQNDMDSEALYFFQKLRQVKELDSYACFCLGVLNHLQGLETEAAKYYEKVLEDSNINSELFQKCVINYVLILDRKREHQKALNLLEQVETSSSAKGYLRERIYSLTYLMHNKLGNNEKAIEQVDHWIRGKSLSETNILRFQSDDIEGIFLIIRGSKQVRYKNTNPLLTYSLIHENDLIITNNELDHSITLIALDDHMLFTLKNIEPNVQKPLKFVIQPFKQFSEPLSNLFESNFKSYPWLILDPTYLPLGEKYLEESQLTVFEFAYQNQIVRNNLIMEDRHILLTKESMFVDLSGRSIDETARLTDIKILVSNTDKDESYILYENIPGFATMNNSELQSEIEKFISFLPKHLSKETVSKKIFEYIYQQFGVLPEINVFEILKEL